MRLGFIPYGMELTGPGLWSLKENRVARHRFQAKVLLLGLKREVVRQRAECAAGCQECFMYRADKSLLANRVSSF